MDQSQLEGELECRVCRCGSEEDRPLYQPCLCNGSIALVHQDCLETWLDHSKKDTCELCSTKYTFTPQYADDTPTVIPLHLMFTAAVKLMSFKFIPFIFRCILAAVLWLFFVPIWSIWVYRIYVRNFSYKAVVASGMKWGPELRADAISGLVLIGVILLSFLILMSFADFVRLFWVGDGGAAAGIFANMDENNENININVNVGGNPNINANINVNIHPDMANVNIDPIQVDARDAPVRQGGDLPAANQNQFAPRNLPPTDVISSENTLNLDRDQRHEFSSKKYGFDKDDILLSDMDVHVGSRSVESNINFSHVKESKIKDLSDHNEESNDHSHYFDQQDMILMEEQSRSSGNNRRWSHPVTVPIHERDRETPGRRGRFFNYTSPADAAVYGNSQSPPSLIGSVSTSFESSSNNSSPRRQLSNSNLMDTENVNKKPKRREDHINNEYMDNSDSLDTKYGELESHLHSPISSPVVGKQQPREPVLGVVNENSDCQWSDAVELEYAKKTMDAVYSQSILEAETANEADVRIRAESLWSLPGHSSSVHVGDGDGNGNGDGDGDDNDSSGDDYENNNEGDDDEIGDGIFPEANGDEIAGDLVFDEIEDDLNDILDNLDGLPPAEGGEVRFALDELLGLRGPLINLSKHVLWFLAFLGVYMCFVMFMPMFLGRLVYQTIEKSFPWVMSGLQDYLLPASIIQFISKTEEFSAANMTSLQLSDFGFILMGYSSVVILVSSWHKLITIKESLFSSWSFYVKFLDNVVIAGKIGTLLSIRILILPISLGMLMLNCFNRTVFNYSNLQWSAYVSKNLVGCMTLSWTLGITFMLVVTLSVLQLREIVHPAIFGKFIRPQETHQELLQSLVNESATTHTRRLAVSTIVYSMLLFFLVYSPLAILQQSLVLLHKINWIRFNPLTQSCWEIRTWFIISEIQIPLEVAVGHFAMLTILEKKKNYIGRFLYAWMVFITSRLNITRFVMPCPRKRIERADGSSEVLLDRNGVPRVGRPLRRPPPGWDARNNRNEIDRHQPINSTRWAWNSEVPSAVELNVAPQIIPENWRWKLLLLVTTTWMMLACMFLFNLFLPVTIGRFILSKLSIPVWGHHDPICFSLGMLVCAGLLPHVSRLSWQRANIMVDIIAHIPLRVYWKIGELIVMWGLSHCSAKMLVFVFLHPHEPIDNVITFEACYFFWKTHRLIIDIFILIGIFGGVDFFLERLGLPDVYGLRDWSRSLRDAFDTSCQNIIMGRFTPEALQLQVYKRRLVQPIFNTVCISYGAFPILLWMLVTILTRSAATSDEALELAEYVQNNVGNVNYVWTRIVLVNAVLTATFAPLKAMALKFYNLIRDENYLIGRKLQNATTIHE